MPVKLYFFIKVFMNRLVLVSDWGIIIRIPGPVLITAAVL